MTHKALSTCEKYKLLEDGGTVLVALSGGADSTALLHFLYSVKEKYHLTILAAHLNHGIRGEEADRDERFCKILCEKYNIPFYSKTLDIPALSKQRGVSEELCGRDERYAFLGTLAEAHNARIATAHNADDNAETLIFNLARGSSLRGAAGIPPKRGRIIRPLIEVTRAQIEEYCAENGLDFVTDSTNLGDEYTRNKIRHHVIPVLRELNPSFEAAVTRFTDTAAEVSDYLDIQADAALTAAETDYGYFADRLLDNHPAVLKTAINILLNKYYIQTDSKKLGLIADILRNGGAAELSREYTAVCRRNIFCIAGSGSPEMPEVELRGSVSFSFIDKLVAASIDNSNKENKTLIFRTRREGDMFSFQKRNITKSLGKALREIGVPSKLRDSVICLCEGSVVLWCEALGYSTQGKIYTQNQNLTIELNGEKCYDVTQGR